MLEDIDQIIQEHEGGPPPVPETGEDAALSSGEEAQQ